MTLELCPCTLKAAGRFVERLHRHNRPPRGALFAIGAEDRVEGVAKLVAVAIVGRPVSRMLQNGYTCEVVRLCTDGTYNACSILYGAARRAAKALGYHRIITYTLASEPGTSLKASGWIRTADVKSTPWNHGSRARPNHDLFGQELRPDGVDKVRWECCLTGEKPCPTN